MERIFKPWITCMFFILYKLTRNLPYARLHEQGESPLMGIKAGTMERLIYIGESRYIVEAWYSDDGGVHASVSEIARNESAPVFQRPDDTRDDVTAVLEEATAWTKSHYTDGSCVEVTV